MLDTRINRYGYMIGQRSDHVFAAQRARICVSEAGFYRREAERHARMGASVRAREDRAYSRWHLAEAARWRRSFADRITPAEDGA